MSGYESRGFVKLRIADVDDGRVEVWLTSDANQAKTMCAVLPERERHVAAQALAGDGFEVVEKLADWERELLDQQNRIDPADVKVGDVVEVEANDGTWMVRGRVGGLDTPDPKHPFWIELSINAAWPPLENATVRLVRRAEPEPDPDPEQVEALAKVMRSLPPIAWDSSEEYARELVRHGVTVGGAS